MPKMIVSIDGVVIKEVQLTKERTTLGRRPYNDIVIDNLAVSGEHAVLQMAGQAVTLEDLNSTNGTYVNGKAVKKQQLQSGDTIEVGKYKIRFIAELESSEYDKTMVVSQRSAGQRLKRGESRAGVRLGEQHVKPERGDSIVLKKTVGQQGQLVAPPRPVAQLCQAFLVDVDDDHPFVQGGGHGQTQADVIDLVIQPAHKGERKRAEDMGQQQECRQQGDAVSPERAKAQAGQHGSHDGPGHAGSPENIQTWKNCI